MAQPFPFSAIVGQDEMKTAILIAAIDPGIGGVLVLGDRGTGKSTAVRALAALLPPMKATVGCRYHCDPAAAPGACDQCEVVVERHGHIAAHVKIAHALIEIADIFLETAGRDRQTDRQNLARTYACAQLAEIGHAVIEHVDAVALLGNQRVISLEAVIADPRHALHIDIADAGVQARPGIEAVDPAFGILAHQRVGGHRPAAIVWRASWPDETVVRTTVGQLAQAVSSRMERTAIMLVGRSISAEDFERFREYFYRRSGIHFESERAIHLTDGTLTTLKMPTGLSERQAISQLLSISLGVGTITPGQSENLLDFINTVDRRLYQAKQNGRNCIVAQDNEKTLAN